MCIRDSHRRGPRSQSILRAIPCRYDWTRHSLDRFRRAYRVRHGSARRYRSWRRASRAKGRLVHIYPARRRPHRHAPPLQRRRFAQQGLAVIIYLASEHLGGCRGMSGMPAFHASWGSLARTVQIVARVLVVVLHMAHALRFPLNQISGGGCLGVPRQRLLDRLS